MMIHENIFLKRYNTFGLNYKADTMIQIETEDEAVSIFNGSVLCKKPFLILGGGSNILFTGNFTGTILYPDIRGINIEESQDQEGYVIISAGAGVGWDEFVEWTVSNRYGGLENLSLIPGKVGATPIQNIGAYGVEVKDMITNVRTINVADGSIRFFNNSECEFSYRNSIFKNGLKGQYLVSRVYFKLTTDTLLNLSYGSLKDEVKKLGEENLMNVRQAVINIRKSKLPDPEKAGNAGSFFKNPIVESSFAARLKSEYPAMPLYEDKEGYSKLASGWLIEQCGWKGKRIGDAGVHDRQALVLVNYGNASGEEILDLSEAIRISVLKKFGIELTKEVEVVKSPE